MKHKLLPLVLACGMFAFSCKKDSQPDQIVNKSIEDITAPDGFNWSGSRDVTLRIGITDNRFQNAIHVIKVYSADPAQGGELLSKGSATILSPFDTKFALASQIKEVYIEKIAPDGTIVSQKLAIGTNDVSASISSTGINGISAVNTRSSLNSLIITTETSPTVPANATVIPSGTQWLSMNANTSYVIKSNSTNINLNDPNANAVLYIDGTGIKIGNTNFKNNLTVIVTSGSEVEFTDNFNWDGVNTFKNFGTAKISTNAYAKGGVFRNQGPLIITKNFGSSNGASVTNTSTLSIANIADIETSFENSGTITFSSSATFKSGSIFSNTSTGKVTLANGNLNILGTFTNDGDVTFTGPEIILNSGNPVTTVINNGNFIAENSKLTMVGQFTNSGTVKVKQLTINSGGTVTNNCKWYVTTTGQYDNQFNGPINNNGYFEISGNITANSGGKITQNNGAMLITKSIESLSEKINGTGTTSVVKITGSINNNFINEANNVANSSNPFSKSMFSGSLQIVFSSVLPAGLFSSPAVQQTSGVTPVYIAQTACMPVQNGTAPVVPPLDTDGDGVPDSQDDYPTDPSRAHKILSQNYLNGGSTVAFEDSWPKKGDYDLNDVVMTYRFEISTDKNNKVVFVSGEYQLLATGGNFQNGAGVQLDIPSGKATNFTGTNGEYLEAGQDEVVVILFKNSRVQQANWNTVHGDPTSPKVSHSFSFKVTDGPTLLTFGSGNHNPFIWNNSPGYGRGYETHLINKKPTKLASTALFGTADDASGNGKYYRTSNNLPWAIEVPIANFKYPVEHVSITNAYKQFANWAISGGTQSVDWYSNQSDTYRNSANLY